MGIGDGGVGGSGISDWEIGLHVSFSQYLESRNRQHQKRFVSISVFKYYFRFILSESESRVESSRCIMC